MDSAGQPRPLLTYPAPPTSPSQGPSKRLASLPFLQIYDVATQQELASGPLPLIPGSNLSWLGFSEEGVLASYDSEGELRMRSPDFGGAWVPLFSSAAGGGWRGHSWWRASIRHMPGLHRVARTFML